VTSSVARAFLASRHKNMQQSQAVSSGLSLESYIQLHRALTKQGHVVQSVTPIEECYYKIGDLRQLLQLHGLTAAKFNRAELLAAIKGQRLIDPCSSNSRSNCNSSGIATTDAIGASAADPGPADIPCDDGTDADLPSIAADCCALFGIQQRSSPQLLKFLRLGSATLQPATAAANALAAGATELPSTAAAAACSADAMPFQPPLGITPAAPAATTAAAKALADAGMTQYQHPPTSNRHGYTPQQAAITASTQLQPQHVPTTTQQHPVLCQPLASVATGAGAHSSMTADPLHRLLATLLTQHTMGPASAGVAAIQPALQLQQLTQPMLQPGPSTGHNPVDNLIQQLLLGSAAHSSSLLQATMAAHAAAQTAAAAVASSARVSCFPTATLPSVKTAPSATTAAGPCATGVEAGQLHKSAHAAVALQLADFPQQPHTPWLKAQLHLFAAHGLRVAQAAAAAAAAAAASESQEGDGGLLGHRVGFVLLDEMQVLGPRNILLTLPPGFYEVGISNSSPCFL
jgi:hypothetical protein